MNRNNASINEAPVSSLAPSAAEGYKKSVPQTLLAPNLRLPASREL